MLFYNNYVRRLSFLDLSYNNLHMVLRILMEMNLVNFEALITLNLEKCNLQNSDIKRLNGVN